jgi:hypothetical protein
VKVYKSFRKLLLETHPEDYGLQVFQEAVGLLKIVQEAVKGRASCILWTCSGGCYGEKHPEDYEGLEVVQDAVKGHGFLKIMVYKPFRRLLMEKAS